MLGSSDVPDRGSSPQTPTINQSTASVASASMPQANVPRAVHGWRFKDLLKLSSGSNTGGTKLEQPPPIIVTEESSSTGSSPRSNSSASSNTRANSVSSCRCCGTILTYPSKSHKFRCSICNTTNILVHVPPAVPVEEDTIHLISSSHIRKLIDKGLRSAQKNGESGSKSLHEIFSPLSTYLQTAFGSSEAVNASFKINRSSSRPHYHSSNINIEEIRESFDMLLKLPTKRPLYSALKGASNALKRISTFKDEDNPQNIRWVLILLEIPFLSRCLLDNKEDLKTNSHTFTENPEIKALSYDILKRSIGILANSETKRSSNIMASWFSKLSKEDFITKVDLLNLYITFHLKNYFYIANNPQLIRRKSTTVVPVTEREHTHERHPTDREYQENSTIKDEISEFNDTTAHGPLNVPLRLQQASPFPVNSKSKKSAPEAKIKIHQYGQDWHIKTAAKVLAIFVKANSIRDTPFLISSFYNSLVDYVNIKLDFDSWQGSRKSHHTTTSGGANHSNSNEPELQSIIDYIHGSINPSNLNENASYYFCHFPFLISLGGKISILEYEARRQMERKAEEAFINSLDKRIAIDIYFKVRVRREFIVQDSLQCIKLNSNNLKKSLKVQFVNEPGIDVGGLKKEWFLLLTKEMFNPNTRMLYNVEDSNLLWFNIKPIENFEMYYLFGAVLGLAIYNSTILELQFPTALYKLLLGIPIDILDYSQLFPSSYSNLIKLKDLSEEDLDALDITFEVSYKDVFETSYTEELISGGSKIQVNKDNLNLFIEKYSDFFMKTSISKQIESFINGFSNVVGGNGLSLFSVEELQLLLCGSNEGSIDVEVLRSVTKYVGWNGKECGGTGNGPESSVVTWFWDMFNDMNIKQRKKLLLFVTGSDRIPATGIQNLNFKISLLNHGKDSNRLPVAHTCFNELALYNYSTKEKFIDKLNKAIYESAGFGIK
ncbi:ubiquitin-protein ligase [Scheffersomyces coipomensis]|uniref:ubiquitin-protein ligase n=1 Tax=Scheffersomyces coipomensis TaxID=1788519 RepID=UPI00315C74F3